MADNVAITPGSGANIAAEQMGDGSYVQRMKPTFGVTDTATDVSATSPLPVTIDTGTLLNRLEQLLIALYELVSNSAGQLPDSMGRTRVTVDNYTATTGTLSTVSTVSTVSNVAKVSNFGLQAPDMMALYTGNEGAAWQRAKIAVT